jgi:hypothetical protein
MLELAFTRATSASWLLKQPDKQEQTYEKRSVQAAQKDLRGEALIGVWVMAYGV